MIPGTIYKSKWPREITCIVAGKGNFGLIITDTQGI